MNLRCPYCNNIVNSEHKFCGRCGVLVDDTFEYVLGTAISNNNEKEDRTIKESLTKSMVMCVLIFLLYFLILPTAISIIYIILSAIFPSVFKDVSALNDSEYMLLNMSLSEISNVLVIGLIFLVIRKNGRIKELFGPKKETKGQALISTIVHGAITFGCMFAAAYIIGFISMFFPSGNEVNANQGLIEAFIRDYPLMGFVSVAIIAPVIEEFIFRFLLCKPIEQKQKWLGVIISSFVFGAIHLVASVQEGTLIQDLPSLITYVGMGAVLGIRYKMTDNVASNMLAHAAYNTMSFLIILFL